MFSFFFELLFIGINCLINTILVIPQFNLKRLNFFFESISFTVKDLTNVCFLFNQLFNLSILVSKRSIKFSNLVLKAIDIFLMIYSHFFYLAFMDSVHFNLQGIFFTFRQPFVFNKLASKHFILFFSHSKGIFVIILLLVEF